MIDEWATSDFTVTPTRRCGGIGFFEAGNDGLNNQWSIKSTNIFNNHQIKYGFTYEDVEFAQVNDRTGPSFVAPDGRSTATGATLEIRSDPVFGQIYRVSRANRNTERLTRQDYWNFFIQDEWRATNFRFGGRGITCWPMRSTCSICAGPSTTTTTPCCHSACRIRISAHRRLAMWRGRCFSSPSNCG